MPFLYWHYTIGLRIYFKRWYHTLAQVNHYFSLPDLLTTLFSPWKRLEDDSELVGFNPIKIFEKVTFNLISRGIGAVVRFFVFIFGSIVLGLVIVGGIVGFFLWIILPPISYPYFVQSYHWRERTIRHLVKDLKSSSHPLRSFVVSSPGRFLLSHTGLSPDQLASVLSGTIPSDFTATDFFSVLKELIDTKEISEEKLRHFGVTFADILLTASWWDSLAFQTDPLSQPLVFDSPGIGQELVFGYTPELNKYVYDYSRPQSFASHLVGREELVSRVERALSTSRNVIIIGQPGVGKRTVAFEFAHRASGGQFGTALSYKRVLELDYNFLLSDSFDINSKKNHLQKLLSEAAHAGNIILVIRDIHRLTNPQIEGLDFSDIFEKYLTQFHLPIIALSTQSDYEQFVAPLTRLRKYFEPIEVLPPSTEDATQILLGSARTWEVKTGIITTTPAVRAIISGSERFITEIPFPEKALELLDHVITFAQRQNIKSISVDHVNQVLSEKTGVSLARLTSKEKELLTKLEEVFHRQLVNQQTAVNLIAKSLRARSLGIKDDKRPIGSFLFLGPTGVGKTESAKVLSQIYYGDTKSVLRFDMAEYSGSEGLTRLIGSSVSGRPGVLTTAIKNSPASLLLLDEIEKSPPEIYNLFLALLDEGEITDGLNRKVLCRNLFVIATSNAGAEYIRQLVNQNVHGDQLQNSLVDYVQKQRIFSPEFLNRFDGVVVFEPLSPIHLTEIARLMLENLKTNLEQKNLHLQITPDLCSRLAQDGYEPAFGARPMRRLVDLTLGDLIATAILKGGLAEGDSFRIVSSAKMQYYIQKDGPQST
ncbi:hypothetical protein A3D85_01330 [Candidatus Amesbacteria bacterium RIFCSPHIGHO2_02_FULL_47_9]|uniref:Sigma-54 factor interaction domain-containing protein n=1 Tax=Candidatus Amesbacteria bacterium RIFCSPHIGHO2_01_FULL_48_32b TaxID=1797253 RepID=A0A1F4YFP0_9BACT|nr:MAG: hypothetical protein A2876_03800 [Candidatus Amesbacteria bacterium RIFCSPHIGHO2_01_FULL_48_32b]OGD04678.1 MAG: hypothetical protein A3D85_01330 [Candidatus Amesbacteria bacterium RIFCSPHIGHO2_02_FULL_47_9]OGD06830.1 MAG: hypothetical protein A2899_05025 [Candidatus Amesbacteria bacterium RIFCSPLOWO2_01_FULL_49_25]